jgi:hypothetical protein
MVETKGLYNYGGTCYFNSFLQLFFNIEEIQKYFNTYNIVENNILIEEKEKKLILILNYFKNIYDIIIGKQNISNYNNLIKEILNIILDRKNIINPLTKQEDSSEVLLRIFEKFFVYKKLFKNEKINEFSELLNTLFYNKIISTKYYDKTKYECDYTYSIIDEYSPLLKINNIQLSSSKNLINDLFKIHNNKIDSIFCPDKDIEIKEFYEYFIYDVKKKYIIINFIPYTQKGISDYGTVELDKSFRVNNINYKIKGIIVHIGNLKGGHYYYLHFENDNCTQYNDSKVDKKYKLSENNNKYLFNTQQQPVIIIYENNNTINPLKKINYDCTHYSIQQAIIAAIGTNTKTKDYIHNINKETKQLKSLIDIHFTELKNLVKILEKI